MTAKLLVLSAGSLALVCADRIFCAHFRFPDMRFVSSDPQVTAAHLRTSPAFFLRLVLAAVLLIVASYDRVRSWQVYRFRDLWMQVNLAGTHARTKAACESLIV